MTKLYLRLSNAEYAPQYPLTLDKIWLLTNNKIGISVNKRKVKELLKNLLNYSYKKGSSGSKILKSDRNKIQKSVFSSRIFLNVYNDKLIINIDESSF